ncbi:fibroblast growth factor receptor 2-like [Actinia tenebrosa]|uniref:receptor protein-tyrosine kinase n=1 Tax=Actinia tenebrosa TaxID=6105 RepID=A0A6P8IXB8_ACTTE|nr:fibroblast growth factor receptor 2-like [Actinia tenebrosa]
MALRILNRNFTKELEDQTSPEYENFVKYFEEQMKIVFNNLDGYAGIEILEIFNGSVRVRYRVVVVVVVKNNEGGSTVTRRTVLITETVLNKAKTGWVEGLQVDKDPKFMELNKSPPPSPKNVTVVEIFKDGVEIAWDEPPNHRYYFIKGYFVEYWKFASEKEKTTTLKGQRTKVTDLESNSPYTARIVAENENGIRGEESAQIEIRTGPNNMPDWLLAIIIIVCIIILIAVMAILIVYCRRKNSSTNKMIEELDMRAIPKEKEADAFPESYVNTMFSVNENCPSFARENLVLMEELGSGEFGVVFKGQLLQNGHSKECAVKTLKGTANPEDYRELHQELDIMVNVGFHSNLVNLIGSCVEEEKLFVIVEFARNGSLFEFLRKARTQPEEKLEFELNYVNRLKIALDVAKGMTHLAKRRCVHRDLAARNVLLADDFVAKVADFGLSRDIYETGEYEKTTVGKLPTRWMAIESLELRRFTLESDVWSFGVLLWEIETKGLMPHGAISFTELLKQQKKGYRLEQPEGTPDELYRVMQMCWQANPKQRPTFDQICNTLKAMLNNSQMSKGNLNEEELEIKQGSRNQQDNIDNQTFA